MFGSGTLRLIARILALVGLPALAANAGGYAECETGLFKIRSDFAGAGMAACTVVDQRAVDLEIRPEDDGRINPSPWYGFHVRALSAGAGTLRVRLLYSNHEHRYAPKVSVDGDVWRRLPVAAVDVREGAATLRLLPDEHGFYVSAQENINEQVYAVWRAAVAAQAGTTWREIGSSVAGRPILALHTNPDARNYLLLLGRQHPPEVPGALAFMQFATRLLALGREACTTPQGGGCRFFQNHDFVLVPLLNPDGVAKGHWRHNLRRTDLNRDWGAFAQPETLAVRDLVDRQEWRGKRLRAMLDFHSTRRNVFYTQDAASITRPADFATRWFKAVKNYGPLYSFEHAPRRLSGQGNAKNYYYRRFGVPSITYEVADEEDRGLIASSSSAFAEALVDVFVAEDEALGRPRPRVPLSVLIDANRTALVSSAEAAILSPTAVANAEAWIGE